MLNSDTLDKNKQTEFSNEVIYWNVIYKDVLKTYKTLNIKQ